MKKAIKYRTTLPTAALEKVCNLGPSSAYSVWSRTVAPIVADPSGAFGVGYASATGADQGRKHDLTRGKKEE